MEEKEAPRVFVSHANADKEYVDGFVNNVLIRGAGLGEHDIFYSSSADTAPRSGQNLMEVVRNEAGKSHLIVAMVTPIYQTRPVCVAELGAAWARGVLFPLMSPGMEREELDGVLPGQFIQSSDDGGALNDLSDRIKELGFEFSARSWGVGIEHWESFLRKSPSVAMPANPTLDQMNQIKAELANSRAALDETKKELQEQVARNHRLSMAKSAAEVREADLPSGENEQFEELKKRAAEALGSMPKSVADAFWYRAAGKSMMMPTKDEYWSQDSLEEQVEVGRLQFDEDSGEVQLDTDYPDVSRVCAEVDALENFLSDPSRSGEFAEWFEKKFDAPMNLKKKGCWDVLVGH